MKYCMGTAAVDGAIPWSNFMSKKVPSASASASALHSRSEEGEGWIWVDSGWVKSWPRYPAPPLLSPHFRHGMTSTMTLHPHPLLPTSRQIILPKRIMTYPSLNKRRFPTTMNTTTIKTMKKTTKSREGTSWLWTLNNQTHNVITKNKVNSG